MINQNTSAVVKNVCILQMLLKVCCFLLYEKKQSKIFYKPIKTVKKTIKVKVNHNISKRFLMEYHKKSVDVWPIELKVE